MNTIPERRRIAFFHPDLGIGGAERLVIDAAVGLQDIGHKVTIFTSHCDPAHCFDEARDGTLDVRVRGNSVFPPSILGRFAILCAILRQLHLVLQICLLSSELRDLNPSAFFVDQLSACVPALRLLYPAARVLFYCHFPDKLLAERKGLLKKLYRVPFDAFEGLTTGASDVIVVNSTFTRGVFGESFPLLSNLKPEVVYPCVDAKAASMEAGAANLWPDKKVLLSINRFERKKNIELAIRAFSKLSPDERRNTRLVIAGGYDTRVLENVSYHRELDHVAQDLGLITGTAGSNEDAKDVSPDISVLFLPSISSTMKSTLLRTALLLVYTPKFEHFGIVPLEAMLAGTPVLAAATGGPTETIVDGQTGWLRSADSIDQWSAVMQQVLTSLTTTQLHAMGEAGKDRVKREFSKERMAQRLDHTFHEVCRQRRTSLLARKDIVMTFGAFVAFAMSLWLIMRPVK